jgi:hypothetical protein
MDTFLIDEMLSGSRLKTDLRAETRVPARVSDRLLLTIFLPGRCHGHGDLALCWS